MQPKTRPFISVIILNWNGRRLLVDCLNSLRCQQFQDFEIVLVDNGSTDESVSLVRAEYPEVQLLELKNNFGFAAGNNMGISQARGKHVLFLNNDTELHPAMLTELSRTIQSDPPDVGAWAVKMLRWRERGVIDNAGCGYSAFGVGYQIGSGEKDSNWDGPTWVFGASGGAGCYRRSVLEDVGFFDEDFFYSNEDVDLSFRMQLAGYRCRLVPTAIVYHQGSATSGRTSDRTIYQIQRNKEWVFFKNMPFRLLCKYLPLHFAYSLGWIGYWTMKGKGRIVLHAHWDALRACPRIVQKRRLIQRNMRRNTHDIDALIDKRRACMFWRSATFRARLGT